MPNGREQYAEKLLGAVNEAAAALSRRFAAFLTVGAYIAITVASTTDEMLVKGASLVTLPLLNVQIPLTGPLGFYSITPWLIVLMHSDLLLQLSALGSKISRFQAEADRLPSDQSELLRERLAGFYYVQYLTGRAPSRSLHLVSGTIMLLTVVVIPLVLLLWILVRFLPFHSAWTWLHRSAVLVDAVLVFWLWREPSPRPQLPARSGGWVGYLRRVGTVRTPAVLVLCALGVVFSVLVGWLPGDPRARGLWLVRRNLDLRERVLTGNSLSLTDINALRGESVEQREDALRKVSPLNSLQGGDLRHASLFNAILPRLDLRPSRRDEGRPADRVPEEIPPECVDRRGCDDPPRCEDPAIIRTRLAGADLRYALLTDARLDQADLGGADLSGTWLQRGTLPQARLNHAVLESAKLPGADLTLAKLCAVKASGADLQGANLDKADLVRAKLRSARLQGANLRHADLQRADLRDADLQGADLSAADFTGARLKRARLEGAVTRGANFTGAYDAHPEPPEETAAGLARRNAHLLALACADADVARGLSRQAVDVPQDRPGLAAALLSEGSRSACPGVELLPAATKETLRRSLKPTAPAD